MPAPLTSPQKKYQIYDYVLAYAIRNKGRLPTIRQICDACDLHSTCTASHQMDRMVLFGMLTRNGHGYELPQFSAVTGMRFLPYSEYLRLSGGER